LRYGTGPEAHFYQQLELKLQYSDESSDQTYVGLTEADFGRDAYRRYGLSRHDNMDNEHKSVVLTHVIEFSESASLTSSGYYNEFTRDWYKVDKIDGEGINEVITCANGGSCDGMSSDYGDYDQSFAEAVLQGRAIAEVNVKHNNRDYESKGIQTRFDAAFDVLSLSHDLRVGLRYHEDFEARKQPVDRYLQGDDGTFSRIALATATRSKKDSDAWSGYVTDLVSVGSWTFKPGLRYEDYTINGVGHDETLWGLGSTVAVTDSWQLLAGIYEGLSPSASADSVPETATNYEAGFRYSGGSLYAEVVGFFSDYDNIIGVCTNSGGAGSQPCEAGDTENGGEAEVKGLEITASYGLELGEVSLPLALAYTYTEAEFKSSFVGESVWGPVEKGDKLPDLPENQLMLSAGVEFDGGYGAELRWRYFDDTCATAACGEFEDIDAHSALDVSAWYDWNPRTRFYLDVDNLTDEDGDIVARKPKSGARGQKPRTLMAGVRYQF
jgi:Fe(3+) dicitrate transport protein